MKKTVLVTGLILGMFSLVILTLLMSAAASHEHGIFGPNWSVILDPALCITGIWFSIRFARRNEFKWAFLQLLAAGLLMFVITTG